MSDIFDLKKTVNSAEIDQLGHVNNVVYVAWMQEVATAHIEVLGLGLNDFLTLQHAMVAVEHHVQYRKPAFLGDEIILRTWLSGIDALYSYRQYAFFRASDRALLFMGSTKWACVELKSGRPKRMSPTFLNAYQPVVDSVDPMQF